ncbi:MAG: hypothetical protein K6G76_09505 [Lachnospiraceae bacterium]|nr:hypothetical protein [Lachnospiraceae bacterium]
MNVNEENVKLEKVIKSCKAAKICSKIFFMLFMAATVITFVAGIVSIVDRDNMDKKIEASVSKSNVTKDITIGSFRVGTVEDGDIKFAKSVKLESSVPSIQKFFDENGDSASLILGMYCILVSVICFVVTFAIWMISTVFDTILKEGNPFADAVVKRILISMIILTGIVGLTSGIGSAVLLGLVTWAVYTIMDYGKLLRIQSDETL